ncbi:hypothetical protein QBC37DRAFT_388682 [Rhypophila decipiens]|uniref:MYND-type domain-containing protein n=1 Tax=Rhypophila decipiens TaxID=261697 RepID=A0AAN6YAR0_9PEZI|nr:hypothetical protein QBC37DRAFT_388682 [Rhypophila decipiens]
MEYLKVWTHMIPKQCETCKTTEGLLRCAGCNTYFYCSREHQAQDRPTHKGTCKAIKDAKKQTDDIEGKLRAKNEFEINPGNFWRNTPQRLYLNARFIHAETLIRSWRRQGIEDALAIYLGMLQHDRADHQGCRHLIPAPYIRLGRDQECYDFLKWWATTVRDEELLTSSSSPLSSFSRSASYGPSKKIFNHREEEPDLTTEQVLKKIRPQVGDILERRPDLIPSGTDIFETGSPLGKAADDLEESVDKLVHKVNELNEYYIPMVLFPGPAEFSAGPQMYTPGSEEEARICFMYTFNAWMETPYSMEKLKTGLVLEMKKSPGSFETARKRWKGPFPKLKK